MTSLSVPVSEQFTTFRLPVSHGLKRRGHTKVLRDIEGLIRTLCANALRSRDTILEVRSANRVKQTMVSTYCIEEVHGLVLVYGEKTALAGTDGL